MKYDRPQRPSLTPRQEMGLLLLLGGMSQVATARALGVHPMTVWKWVNRDRRFISFYRERLQQVWDWQRNEVSKVLKQVMDTSLELISRGDLKSIEDGVKLFMEATRKLPPAFEHCPGDGARDCPHIPGRRLTALDLYYQALRRLEIEQARGSEDKSGDTDMRRLLLYGQLADALKDDIPG